MVCRWLIACVQESDGDLECIYIYADIYIYKSSQQGKNTKVKASTVLYWKDRTVKGLVEHDKFISSRSRHWQMPVRAVLWRKTAPIARWCTPS